MNTTIKILTLALGLAAAGPWDLYANPTSPTLFRMSSAKISAANDPAYDELLKSRKADSIVLVDINADAINENTDTFSLGLKGMSNIAYKLSAEKTPSGSIVWQGTFGKRIGGGDFLKQRMTGELAVDPMNYIQVTRHKDVVVGSMHYNGESYDLVPTTKGYAFIKVNPSLASHCEQDGRGGIGPIALRRTLATMNNQPTALRATATATTVYTANVLFGITTSAYTSMGGTGTKVQAVVDNMIATTNRVFTTTGLSGVRLQSAGIYYFVTYASSTSPGTDYTAITSSNHPDMVAFRAAKTRVKSDIAAVIGTYGGGIATFGASTAGNSNLASGYPSFYGLVFAHEVGHIYGAGHQPGNGGSTVSYGRAYNVSTGSFPFATVMYTPTSSRTIEYYSNVDYKYQNQSMGSTTQNNKFVILTNAQKIAGFAN